MKKSLTLLAAATCPLFAAAQIDLGRGQIAASFETNTTYYVDDSGLDATLPQDKFGSNNYLKVDYTYGRFSAGIQAEAYLPALYGYEIGTMPDGKTFFLANKYVQWHDENFSILVGDSYDQFGNGLIYRSYEDRQLGINNSLEGVAASYSFAQYARVKGIYGRPRLYTDYADTWIRGLDLDISLSNLLGTKKVMWSVAGSYVNRYESLDKDPLVDFSEQGLTDPSLNMVSGRMELGWKGLQLKGEYVAKSRDIPAPNARRAVRGAALFAEAIYGYRNLSVSATFRILDNMGVMRSLYGTGTANSLNYLPALTRQYTYLLANLNPYQVDVLGETAAQADVYYSLRSKSDRRRYWNFHANFSTAYTVHPSQSYKKDPALMWRDVNFDVERQWSRSLKTLFLFSRQEWSPSHGHTDELYASNIFVGDVTYKFNRRHSLRAEVQYLLSDDYEGDWVAGLVEFSVAPKWSFFVSDMYNTEVTLKNYYNAGFSYTKNRTRVQLSYGRNRAGYVCSGGVCRYSPAYTGLNMVLTSSF